MITDGIICKYMNENIQDHVDPKTGEVNDTSLAEDACSHFNDYESEDNIPGRYFDLAFKVGTKYELKSATYVEHEPSPSEWGTE